MLDISQSDEHETQGTPLPSASATSTIPSRRQEEHDGLWKLQGRFITRSRIIMQSTLGRSLSRMALRVEYDLGC